MNIIESNVTINVKNLDESIAFYQSIGFALKNRWGDHYAQLVAPGLVIGLHPSTNANAGNGSGNISIGFATDDLDRVKSQLESLSIEVSQRKEQGGDFLHFSDPDGTSLYFIKPKW